MAIEPRSSLRVIDPQWLLNGGPVLEDVDRGETQEDEMGVCMDEEESGGKQWDDMAGQRVMDVV